MDLGISQVYPVNEPSQISDCRRQTQHLARQLGFNEVETANVAIVITELGTNLLKHTQRGGQLLVQGLKEHDEFYIDIASTNDGPGSSSPDRWLEDGYSTAQSLGTGLGAVRRLAQRFDLYSEAELGTIVTARMRSNKKVKSSFDIAAVCRAKPGEIACGDNWAARQDGTLSLLCIIDGLGHGIDAARASATGRDAFFSRPMTESPKDIVQHLHSKLSGTRGAAVAVAAIDTRTEKLMYCGLGNISGWILTGDERKHLMSDNGTAGYEARKIREWSFPWSRDSRLIMHSDGVSSRCAQARYSGLFRHNAATVAATIYRDHNKSIDDATVAVLKEASQN